MDLKTKGDKRESCTDTSIQTGIEVGVSKTQRPTLAWKVGFSASLEPPGIKMHQGQFVMSRDPKTWLHWLP